MATPPLKLTTEYTSHLLERLVYLEKLFTSSSEVSDIENSLKLVNKDIDKLYNCIVLSGEYYHQDAKKLITELNNANERLLKKGLPFQEDVINRKLETITLAIKEPANLQLELQKNEDDFNASDKTIEETHQHEEKILLIREKIKLSLEEKFRKEKELRRLNIYQSSLRTAKGKIESYKKYNKHLYYLIDYINARLDREDIVVIDAELSSDIIKYRELALEDKSKEDYSAYFIFLINVKLAETDEAYLCNRQTLFQLIDYAANLLELTEGEALPFQDKDRIVECVKQKCRFLILKTLRRFKRTDSTEFITTATTKSLKFSIDSLADNIPLLKSLDKKTFIHYFSAPPIGITNDTCFENVRKLISEGKTTIITASNEIEIIHFLFKFVKNSAKEIINGSRRIKVEDLEKLLNELLTHYYIKKDAAKKDDKFNLFSYESAVMLISNALFILEVTKRNEKCSTVQDCKLVINFLHKEFSESEDDYRKEKSLNVLLYRNYFELLSQCLEKFTSVLDNLREDDLISLDGLIKQLEETFENCYTASTQYIGVINKAIQQIIYPTYLSISECIITTDIVVYINDIPKSASTFTTPASAAVRDESVAYGKKDSSTLLLDNNIKLSLNLFIDSSYILPSNYDHLLKKAEIKILEIKNLEDQIYHKLFNREISSETHKFEKRIDDKVKESQWSAIQIIGLYAAFISFVLGSVGILPKFEKPTPELLLIFLFVFASALTLFISLLKLIFQADSSTLPIKEMIWFSFDEKGRMRANKYFIFVGTCASILIAASLLLFRFSNENGIIIQKDQQLKTDSLNTMRAIEQMKDMWHKDSLNYTYRIDSLKCIINPKKCIGK